MNLTIVSSAFAAGLLLAAMHGPAPAQTNAPPNNGTPSAVTTGDPQSTPIISPAAPEAQNPGVNPSAAGTQLGRNAPTSGPEYRPGYGTSGNGSAPPQPK